LSLRELIFIAVKEHGLNIHKVIMLTQKLTKSWREDCWDGLYKYLEKPDEGDTLFKQYTRPFETLGLEPTATLTEVKSAYRTLARQYHPDKTKDDSSKDVFVQIQKAYSQLKKRFKEDTEGVGDREL
jgi:DnaJ-domain-containing protein 1